MKGPDILSIAQRDRTASQWNLHEVFVVLISAHKRSKSVLSESIR